MTGEAKARIKVGLELSSAMQSARLTWHGFSSLDELLSELPKIRKGNAVYFRLEDSHRYSLKISVAEVKRCHHCEAHLCRGRHTTGQCKCMVVNRDIPDDTGYFPEWCPLREAGQDGG